MDELQVPELILASASPRRHSLLSQIGLSFDVRVSRIDESSFKDLPPAARVEALALAKAKAVADSVSKDVLVIGADTVVVCQDQVLGKPASVREATAMLNFLSGRTHTVYTGVALVQVPGGKQKSTFASTDVTFNRLAPAVIDSYVATGEPMDKAGGYGIQGRGALLISSIKGDYFNIVGLPLVKVAELMEQFGFDIWGVISR